MREELAKLKGVRRKFQGTFDSYGVKSGWQGRPLRTILLIDVQDCLTHKIVTDHLWINETKQFATITLQKGDTVSFYARVTEYTKGYRGRREDVFDKPIQIDYRLSFPTKIAKTTISKAEHKMKCPVTGKLEEQETLHESEDGITLRCCGCGKVHPHEIGELANWF
jgi:hypothetical protein